MANYPIVQKNEPPAATVGGRPLPIFYMEDFSVLGFQVNNSEQAIRVLDRHAFSLTRVGGSIAVSAPSPSQLIEIMQLLKANGLECEFADLAGGMYQG